MNSQVNKEKLTQIADHLQLLIEDLGDEGRDVDSEICIKAHDALRNIIATPATIPDADHCAHVLTMVVPDRSKEFSQFLTSVITAAGLLAYGKRSKGLASYLSDKAMMYMLAASPSAKGGE